LPHHPARQEISQEISSKKSIFGPSKKIKNKATYPAKNAIILHKMPAVLVVEIPGVFINQNT
jgi:hypothetical protein